MRKETYNGWTNYATWNVFTNLFSDLDTEKLNDGKKVEQDLCQEYANSVLFQTGDTTSEVVNSYVRLFLSKVDWNQIAGHINEEIKNQ